VNGARRVWLNGRLLDGRRPVISAYDRGFLHGDGVYETLRVYNGAPFRFDRHVQRLEVSAAAVHLRIPYPRAALRRAVDRLLRADRLKEAVVRITLTRGPGPRGFDPTPCRTPTLAVMAWPAAPVPESTYRRGYRVAVVRVRRPSKESLDPAVKSTNNLNNILARMESLEHGADEALQLNAEGYLAEGTASNVFFVAAGALKTPSLDCGLLAGVTRAEVVALARLRSLPVVEGRFRPRDLLAAKEVFLTSTTLEVMPVTCVVDEQGKVHAVGNGLAGVWAPLLRQDYRRRVERETGPART
jgi:branched-chain amino acid aminotransferase